MSTLKRAIGLEKSAYHPVQLDQQVTTSLDDIDGVPVEIIPNPENDGADSMASVYESLHNPATDPHHTFEIWFYKGVVRFFLIANDERSADTFRRGINNDYPDSELSHVDEGSDHPPFPTVTPEDSLAGAYVQKVHQNYGHQYLPIKLPGNWKAGNHPIAKIIGQMNGSEDARVVVQGVLRPVPDSWTKYGTVGSIFRLFDLIPPHDISANDAKNRLRWDDAGGLTKYVDAQTEQPAFATNLRILAISPDPGEASERASGVAGVFERKFKSESGARFRATPIDSRSEWVQQKRMRRFLDRMRYRYVNYETDTVLGAQELTAINIPSGDEEAPRINWKRGRSGAEVPVDRPKHSVPDLDDLEDDGDSGFVVGGDS